MRSCVCDYAWLLVRFCIHAFFVLFYLTVYLMRELNSHKCHFAIRPSVKTYKKKLKHIKVRQCAFMNTLWYACLMLQCACQLMIEGFRVYLYVRCVLSYSFKYVVVEMLQVRECVLVSALLQRLLVYLFCAVVCMHI